jgi:hypothetical protein
MPASMKQEAIETPFSHMLSNHMIVPPVLMFARRSELRSGPC